MHLISQLWMLPAHVALKHDFYIFLPLVGFLTAIESRFVPVQGRNQKRYNISEFVTDLQHLKEQLFLFQKWDSATQVANFCACKLTHKELVNHLSFHVSHY